MTAHKHPSQMTNDELLAELRAAFGASDPLSAEAEVQVTAALAAYRTWGSDPARLAPAGTQTPAEGAVSTTATRSPAGHHAAAAGPDARTGSRPTASPAGGDSRPPTTTSPPATYDRWFCVTCDDVHTGPCPAVEARKHGLEWWLSEVREGWRAGWEDVARARRDRAIRNQSRRLSQLGGRWPR